MWSESKPLVKKRVLVIGYGFSGSRLVGSLAKMKESNVTSVFKLLQLTP